MLKTAPVDLPLKPPKLLKPSSPYSVNWTNPITRNMVAASIGNRSLVGPSTGVMGAERITSVGPAFSCTGTTYLDFGAVLNKVGPITLVALYVANTSTPAAGTQPEIFGAGDRATLRHLIFGGNPKNTFFTKNSSAGWTEVQSSVTAVNNRLNLMVGRHTATLNTVVSAALGAEPVFTSIAASAREATSYSLRIGLNSETSRSVNGAVVMSAAFTRDLTDSEIRSLFADPWQLFRSGSKPFLRIQPPDSSFIVPLNYKNPSQPQSNLTINWGNPITRGMCVVSIPSTKYGVLNISPYLVDMFATKYGSSPSVSPGAKGVAAKLAVDSTDAWRLHSTAQATNTAFERPTSSVTVATFLRRFGNNSNGNAPIFSNGSPNTAPYCAWGLIDRAGTDNISFEIAAGGSPSALDSGVQFGTAPVLITGVWDGVTKRLFKNSTQVASASKSGNLDYVAAVDRGPSLGNFYTYPGGRSFNGEVYVAMLWDRALSDVEIKSLSDNPWQVLLHVPQKILPLVDTRPSVSITPPLVISYTSPPKDLSYISPHWLQRGLQMVVHSGTVVFNRDTKSPSNKTITGGPKSQISRYGPVVGFGTTWGTGTTDRIDGGKLTPPSTSKRSIVAQLYPKTTGGGTLGRVYQDVTGSGTAAGEGLWINSTTGITYSIFVSSAAAAYQWQPASPLTLEKWQVLGFSLSFAGSGGSSPADAYIDGKFVANHTAYPLGSLPGTNSATNMTFGNRASDSARSWDGMIGLILIFDGFLTAREHAQLAANPWQVFAPRQIAFSEASFSADAVVTLIGASISCVTGNISATGGAILTISGASTTSNVGDIGATGGAGVSLIGASSTSNIGSFSATGGATASFSGASVLSYTGIVSVNAGASTTLIGAYVSGYTGIVSAEGEVPYNISLRQYVSLPRTFEYTAAARNFIFDSDARNNTFTSMSRTNEFMAPSRTNEFVSPSRTFSFVSPSRTSIFVSASRDNLFTSPERTA